MGDLVGLRESICKIQRNLEHTMDLLNSSIEELSRQKQRNKGEQDKIAQKIEEYEQGINRCGAPFKPSHWAEGHGG